MMQVNALAGNAFTALEAPDATNSTLDRDAFFKVLVAQLRYQDPMSPMDNTAFVTQLAQMSSLEQMQNLSQSLNHLFQMQVVNQTLTLLGREATVEQEDGQLVAGKVEKASFKDGLVRVLINGKWYQAERIVEVGV